MQIPINFHSAELLTSSLCQTIIDAMAQAGADAENTLPKLREASRFAHELARFLDALSQGISAEIPAELPAMARTAYHPLDELERGLVNVAPICRIDGRGLA